MRRLINRAIALAAVLSMVLGMLVPAAPSCAAPGIQDPVECPCCDMMPAGLGCPQSCQPAVPDRAEPARTPAESPAWLVATASRLHGEAPAPLEPPPR